MRSMSPAPPLPEQWEDPTRMLYSRVYGSCIVLSRAACRGSCCAMAVGQWTRGGSMPFELIENVCENV